MHAHILISCGEKGWASTQTTKEHLPWSQCSSIMSSIYISAVSLGPRLGYLSVYFYSPLSSFVCLRKLRMNVHTYNQITQIYNVIGRIRGALEPGTIPQYISSYKNEPMRCCVFIDRYVILGGHRDAWVFGGIDPMSGSAVTHETIRSAGRMLSKGQ